MVYTYLPFMILPLYSNLGEAGRPPAGNRLLNLALQAVASVVSVTLPLVENGSVVAGAHAGVHPGGG